MSAEETVERAWRTIFVPDGEALEGYEEIFHDDFVWKPRTGVAVSGKTYQGRAGLTQYLLDLGESFEQFVPHDTEYQVEGDLVLASSRISVRGRESGIELEHDGAVIWELRDGRVASARAFFSHAEAKAEFEARVHA